MAVTADNPAPYAPARAVLDLMGRYRERGQPRQFDAEALERLGTPPSLVSRTLYALQALDLIDESGAPTKVLEGLRLAPESEYHNRQADWLREAYSDVFSFVDLENASAAQIRDAFRTYRPHGQQDRMVSLFTGLCAAAGLMPERQPSAPRQRSAAARAPRQPLPATRVVSATGHAGRQRGGGGTQLPPPIAGLLATLPLEAGWTKAKREQFVNAFGTVLDLCVPIVKEEPNEIENGDP